MEITFRWFWQQIEQWRGRHLRALFIAGLSLLLPIGLWFIGWLFIGDDWLPIRWGAYVAPWLAGVALASAGFLVLGKQNWFAIAGAVLCVLILAPVLPRFSPARWVAHAQPGDLRVLTFNTSDLNTDFAAIARVIEQERPDIVFLQQIRDLKPLRSRLLDHGMQYDSYPEHTADTVILSRFRLVAGRQEGDKATAIAEVGRCRIRLWSLHAPHGQVSVRDQKAFFDTAAMEMHSEKLPIIAGGDLNSTEYNSVQAPLRSELEDAFSIAGRGLGFTFPSRVRRFGALGRLFRIDHLFYRGSISAASSTVMSDNAGSDHFPVMARFDLSRC